MSLYSTIELAIQVEHFKNIGRNFFLNIWIEFLFDLKVKSSKLGYAQFNFLIDLYNQGFYRCDFKLYYFNEDTKIYAKPVAIKISDITKKKRKLWKEVT